MLELSILTMLAMLQSKICSGTEWYFGREKYARFSFRI